MRDGSSELQRVVFATLDGNLFVGESSTDTDAVECKVYDAVPPQAPKPYLVLGDAEVDQWDTKDSDGTEQALNFQIFSEYRGRKELKQIAGQVYDLLHHADLTLNEHQCVLLRFDHANYPLEADGITRRGELRYVALLSTI